MVDTSRTNVMLLELLLSVFKPKCLSLQAARGVSDQKRESNINPCTSYAISVRITIKISVNSFSLGLLGLSLIALNVSLPLFCSLQLACTLFASSAGEAFLKSSSISSTHLVALMLKSNILTELWY